VKQKNPTYTIILHQPRKRLGLSLMEYCVADCIYHLSNNPRSKVLGWCYSSKENIAKFLGTSSVTIFNNIDKLIEKGLVEKDNETKYLQTTKKWYENVIVSDYKETLEPIKKLNKGIKKLYTEPLRNFIPDHKETLYNSNKDNNINKDSNKNLQSKIAGINDILEIFYEQVNPTINFGNKTSRDATSFLIKKFGLEQTKRLAMFSCSVQGKEYAPTITTPYQLKEKLASLKIYTDRLKSKDKEKEIKIL